jgi:hypothetical protein
MVGPGSPVTERTSAMSLVFSLASTAGDGLGILHWVGILIGGIVLAAILWLVALVVIVGSHRLMILGKIFWILGTLTWPIVGPFAYPAARSRLSGCKKDAGDSGPVETSASESKPAG